MGGHGHPTGRGTACQRPPAPAAGVGHAAVRIPRRDPSTGLPRTISAPTCCPTSVRAHRGTRPAAVRMRLQQMGHHQRNRRRDRPRRDHPGQASRNGPRPCAPHPPRARPRRVASCRANLHVGLDLVRGWTLDPQAQWTPPEGAGEVLRHLPAPVAVSRIDGRLDGMQRGLHPHRRHRPLQRRGAVLGLPAARLPIHARRRRPRRTGRGAPSARSGSGPRWLMQVSPDPNRSTGSGLTLTSTTVRCRTRLGQISAGSRWSPR